MESAAEPSPAKEVEKVASYKKEGKKVSEKQYLHLQKARAALKTKRIKEMAEKELKREQAQKMNDRLDSIEQYIRAAKRKPTEEPSEAEPVKEKRKKKTEEDGPSTTIVRQAGSYMDYITAGIAASVILGVGYFSIPKPGRQRSIGNGEGYLPL